MKKYLPALLSVLSCTVAVQAADHTAEGGPAAAVAPSLAKSSSQEIKDLEAALAAAKLKAQVPQAAASSTEVKSEEKQPVAERPEEEHKPKHKGNAFHNPLKDLEEFFTHKKSSAGTDGAGADGQTEQPPHHGWLDRLFHREHTHTPGSVPEVFVLGSIGNPQEYQVIAKQLNTEHAPTLDQITFLPPPTEATKTELLKTLKDHANHGRAGVYFPVSGEFHDFLKVSVVKPVKG